MFSIIFVRPHFSGPEGPVQESLLMWRRSQAFSICFRAYFRPTLSAKSSSAEVRKCSRLRYNKIIKFHSFSQDRQWFSEKTMLAEY